MLDLYSGIAIALDKCGIFFIALGNRSGCVCEISRPLLIRVALLYINREGNNLAREKHSRVVDRVCFCAMLFSSVREWECEELLLSGREERKRERKVHRGGAGKKKKCEREEEEPRSGEGRRDNGCT